jgi:hypothetical protein
MSDSTTSPRAGAQPRQSEPSPDDSAESQSVPQRNESYATLLDRPISFHRTFKTITGNTAAALFLSQAYNWSRSKTLRQRPGHWMWKSSDEWQEETGLTRNEQETARKKCVQLKVMEVKNMRHNGHGTLHYRVNTARLFELIEQIPSLRESDKLIDCENPANYTLQESNKLLNTIKRNTKPSKRGEGLFKTWQGTPEQYHPYFATCTTSPVALPEPTSKEITTWLETFDEWIAKGFTTMQIATGAKWAHENSKIVASPKSLTWILNSNHARASVHKDNQSAEDTESVIAKLRNKKRM